MPGSARSVEPRPEDEEPLWAAYRRGDEAAHERLVELYTPLARRLAAQLFARRSDGVADFSDYHHYGMVGLLEALCRFEPGRGASFSTYATYRIRGAILNGTERLSEQRSLYAHRARVHAERARSLRRDASRRGSEEFAALVDVAIGLTLGVLIEDEFERIPEPSEVESNPYSACAVAEVRERLLRAVDELPEREQFVVRRHYVDGVSFAELALSLRLTRGRISQIHARALRRIREAHEASRFLDEAY